MIFGHNTNVSVGKSKYHVQTEDAGTASALIDTTVYGGGRVLHRRTNNYLDLVPLNPDREEALKLRLDEQHRQVLEEIRTGALSLPPSTPPQPAAPAPAPAATLNTPAPSGANAPPPEILAIELVNAKTWLAGKRATLHLRITDSKANPLSDAKVTASVSGAAEPANFFAESDDRGEAQLAFDMPRLTAPNAELLIETTRGNARGQLRFQLRARQRVPVS
ncbi:MAG: hypothetical protein M3P45_14705 [Acidobacteriota bacterium]|nr:hypothetical protein [Acidobacteriota bacterium]